MAEQSETARHAPGRAARAVAAVTALLLAVTACSGDDDAGGSGDAGASGNPSELGGDQVAQLLGPEDPASGEPVRVGIVTDGATQAYDSSDEPRAAQAAADYWNEHKKGIGGRPIELVTCETGGDPAGGTDCGNRMVEEGVVAVIFNTSAVAEQAWEPLHDAGVPTMLYQATADRMNADTQSTYLLVNPIPTLFGLPVSLAQSAGADNVAFVVIDVPVAVNAFESNGPEILENAGIGYEVVKVPVGTPDMTPQMQQVVESGAGVVHVLGNDTFCVAAFQGLQTAGYTGEIAAVSQCIDNATREAMPGQLEGINVLSSVAIGAADDPTYQLYQAVMSTYGQDVRDTENINAMGSYTVMSSLATALEGITGDINPQTVNQTIKAMPEQPMPGGGGTTFRCGGSAMATYPAVCTNQWLRTTLDADGQPQEYEVQDSSAIVEGL
jgi:branched-chain amino acid transport system substrate-binding protein